MSKEKINSSRQELFNHMSEEHELTLLQSEMMEIERIVIKSQSDAVEKIILAFEFWKTDESNKTIMLKLFAEAKSYGDYILAIYDNFKNREQ